ncbi:MAG: hypothetical protein Q4G02_01040, partial [bacterium]|nr:hypothetical protein [bacterium]
MDEIQPDIQASNKRTWMIVSVILLIIVAVLFFFLIKGRKTSPETSVATVAPTQKTAAVLGGTITFSGLLPSESDQATVKILFRDADADSATDFVNMGLSLPAQNNTPWQYNQAVAGENYEVVAALMKDGIVIETSETEEVTAPALHINLDFDLEYDELGLNASSLPKQEISGKIQINGYIPSDSSIQVIESLNNQEQTWLTLAANASQIPFTISQVAPEKNYTLYANLLDKSGRNIGKSDGQIVANSGDTQVNFVIQSQAVAPATPKPTPVPASATPVPVTKAKMSGQVLVNGPMNANSRLLILGKRPQDSDYQV